LIIDACHHDFLASVLAVEEHVNGYFEGSDEYSSNN
jgi:hypothetical protein